MSRSETSAVVTLIALNLYIIWPLAGAGVIAQLQANDLNYASIGRVLLDHPSDFLWWPLWNGGIPFTHTYFPLVPVLVALAAKIGGISTTEAYHTVCAVLYAAGPVTLFLMAWTLSKRLWPSWMGAILYSLWSPSLVLVPAIGASTGDLAHSRRLYSLLFHGEGPHVVSLTLLPLAVICLHAAWTERGRWRYAACAVSFAAVSLSNAVGAVSLALAVIALALAYPAARRIPNLRRTGLIAAGTYIWISPLLPPSLLWSIRSNSANVTADYSWRPVFWLGALGLVGAMAAAGWAMSRSNNKPHVRFLVHFALLTGGVTILSYRLGIHLLPQPFRYHLEMEMAVCLTLAFWIWRLAQKWPRLLQMAAAMALLGAAVYQTSHQAVLARSMTKPVDFVQTSEYAVAKWLHEHRPSDRAMISGEAATRFNLYWDTPQLSGGHDTTAPNRMQRVAVYTIYSGDGAGARDAWYSVLWLKAFGTTSIAVPNPQGPAFFKPFAHPRKFDGVLPVLWRDSEDVVYDVPQRSGSLAHVIPEIAAIRLAPKHGLDTAAVERFVVALEDPALPLPDIRWHDFRSAEIHAKMQPGELLSLQVNYHPGWSAFVQGVERKVSADGIGLMLVDARCDGDCEIRLRFDGGPEWEATIAASMLVMLAFAAVFFRSGKY